MLGNMEPREIESFSEYKFTQFLTNFSKFRNAQIFDITS